MPRYGETEQYTFPYTFNDLRNPVGRNDLATDAKFFQRSVYKEGIYPSEEGLPLPLDTWYDKNLFGRVDQCQNTIMADTMNLVAVRKAVNSNIFCFNFVERAFHALADHMSTAYAGNCLDRSGNKEIWNLKAVRAYTDPTRKWNAFIDSLGDAFAGAHLDRPGRMIKNFSDFVPLFREYLVYVAETYPINKENFFLSHNVSPLISALSISISRKSASNDYPKYADYINDPNFKFYVRAAKKYGFLVNKYMPWVLTADLFTDAVFDSTKFFQVEVDSLVYNITEGNFFNIYYHKPYRSAFSTLRYVFARCYMRLVLQKPLYSEKKILFRPNCPDDPYKEINSFRTPYTTMGPLMSQLDDKFLIDLYIQLRHLESGNSYPSLKNARKRAYEVYVNRPHKNYSAMRNVLEFVNAIYRVYIYPVNYGNITTQKDIDKLVISNIIDTGVELSAEPACTTAYSGGELPPEEDPFEREETKPDPTKPDDDPDDDPYIPPVIPVVIPPDEKECIPVKANLWCGEGADRQVGGGTGAADVNPDVLVGQ